MTAFNFDEIIDRTGHHSAKWGAVADGCLPMWVADMDFRSPPSAIDAMIERARHGVFGYTLDPLKLKEAVVERMERLYDWRLSPDDILFSPGMVLGALRNLQRLWRARRYRADTDARLRLLLQGSPRQSQVRRQHRHGVCR